MTIRYGIDTNILLRVSRREDALQSLITKSMLRLADRDIELCFTPQNLGEFWNVSTRPIARNGFGLSIAETEELFQSTIQTMTLLPENDAIFQAWFRLLLVHEVRGVQVHEAHLAATLEVHCVAHLLTFNGPDFKRFPNLIPVHPMDVLP